MSAPRHTADYDAALDRDACGKCGREVYKVDLYGRPFFTHKPRPDCLTWWHVDENRNVTHQAVPSRVFSPGVTE